MVPAVLVSLKLDLFLRPSIVKVQSSKGLFDDGNNECTRMVQHKTTKTMLLTEGWQ
ncbi:hypothetical protein SAMN04488051_104249 [Alkalimonas amylolytica]|uniref:Uncharacterized protein n=1 Tax=Alkalimonas amylolytica TaxID=152573 RepID=A0A1H4CNM1_ALKAM|nr:hypothetical protein SAMN04488051_104249 [Alkalimonas amylolytica]